ncbi:hypothetical protein L541_2783 [Bordetella hinzii CA90 BAL1384]|uniref:Uncharacterized protein n=2 Tax=Bordetella TaxID=517 RepID=A0A0M7DK56_9BORD|nr:hypothetical protein L544_2540 [Bordetella hinzii OH87 BAL007II]KCB32275.1 hypothetical protein L541_2783 [Bordetella hinzii CA90 BAL1384]KCB40490.1 hypothetical protein L539_3010 [Bordetella hinzii 5132]CUI54628.1 Uncharacterised protein [Bordetella pseudohinzii]
MGQARCGWGKWIRGLLILLVFILGVAAGIWLARQYAIDLCLDAGGSWTDSVVWTCER